MRRRPRPDPSAHVRRRDPDDGREAAAAAVAARRPHRHVGAVRAHAGTAAWRAAPAAAILDREPDAAQAVPGQANGKAPAAQAGDQPAGGAVGAHDEGTAISHDRRTAAAGQRDVAQPA